MLLSGCVDPGDPRQGTDDPAEGVDTSVVQEAPARTTPDEPGPYAVAATTVHVSRAELGELVAEVWYPTRPTDNAAPAPYGDGILALAGDAFRDTPVDRRGAPYPVVVFSHGFGGIRYQSIFLTEFLASHGFVVIAPDHAGSTLLDLDLKHAADVAVRRPRDVRDAVDALRDGVVEGLEVDTERYAVVGHSFGAWTALAVGGGVIDSDAFAEVCANEDPTACSFFVDQRFNAADAGRYATPDPRATVTVALAPGGWYAFSADGSGLAGVRNPLVLGGTRDSDLPYETETLPTYAALGGPKSLGGLQNAGHWGFSNLCDLLPFDDCAGPSEGFMDPERTHALVNSRVLAHLTVHLLGEQDDLAWLAGADDLAWEQEP